MAGETISVIVLSNVEGPAAQGLLREILKLTGHEPLTQVMTRSIGPPGAFSRPNVKRVVSMSMILERRIRYSPLSRHRLCALVLAGTAICLSACATSHVMIGKARPPISPEAVQVYMRPPNAPYEEIARLQTSSQMSFAFTAQGKTDAVIKRLKEEAAKLGANGVLLEGIGDEPSGSIGTGGGSTSYSRGSSVGGGIGISAGLNRKVGGGVAIYMEQQ